MFNISEIIQTPNLALRLSAPGSAAPPVIEYEPEEDRDDSPPVFQAQSSSPDGTSFLVVCVIVYGVNSVIYRYKP